MAIYVANENGDWWGTSNDQFTSLYVFDTEKLTLADKIQILDKWGDGFTIGVDDPETIDAQIDEIIGQDKFEKVIWEFGRNQLIRI